MDEVLPLPPPPLKLFDFFMAEPEFPKNLLRNEFFRSNFDGVAPELLDEAFPLCLDVSVGGGGGGGGLWREGLEGEGSRSSSSSAAFSWLTSFLDNLSKKGKSFHAQT